MNQAQHPLLRYFQEKFRKFSGVAPVLFYGRGIFQYNFGLLPHRVPLYIVGKSYSGEHYFVARAYPAGIYLFKFNRGITRIKCEIFSKLTIKTPKK